MAARRGGNTEEWGCGAGVPRRRPQSVSLAAGLALALLVGLVAPLGVSGGAAAQEPTLEVPGGDPLAGQPTEGAPTDDPAANPEEPDEPEVPPIERVRPAIRELVKELDAAAGGAAALEEERVALLALAAERRAAATEQAGPREVAAERLRRATLSVERAQARRDETAAQAERLTTQAQQVAMGLYLEGKPIIIEGLLPGRNPLSAVVAHETVRAGVRAATDAYRVVADRLVLLEASLARRVGAFERAQLALAEVDTVIAALETEAAAAEAEAAAIAERIPVSSLAALATQERIVGLLRLAGSPAHQAVDPALSIIGPAALGAEQVASWLTTPAGGGLSPERAAELAAAYLEEGAAVGVRGDVAVAQAVLETGGFRFTGSNNFAGIGHCDSCPRGFAYPTLREGVRAQVQLLRAYADGDIDPATLPGGPVSGLSLGTLSVRGCCVSWWGLTGVWATALHYGGSILRIYESMLAHASATPAVPR